MKKIFILLALLLSISGCCEYMEIIGKEVIPAHKEIRRNMTGSFLVPFSARIEEKEINVGEAYVITIYDERNLYGEPAKYKRYVKEKFHFDSLKIGDKVNYWDLDVTVLQQ